MLDLVSKCYIQTSLATSWIWYIKVLKHFCNQSWFPFQHLSLLIIYKQTLPLTSSLVSLIACMIKNRYMVSGVKVSFDGMARRLANAVFPHMQGLNEHLLWCWHPTKLRHSGTSLWQKVEIARQRRSWWTVTVMLQNRVEDNIRFGCLYKTWWWVITRGHLLNEPTSHNRKNDRLDIPWI